MLVRYSTSAIIYFLACSLLWTACKNETQLNTSDAAHVVETPTLQDLPWEHPYLKQAEVLQAQQKTDSANVLYLQARGLFQEDQQLIGELYCLSQVTFNNINSSSSLETVTAYLNELEQLARQNLERQDPYWAWIYLNKGLYAYNNDDLDSAIHYYKTALDFHAVLDPQQRFATTAHNLHRLGDAYYYQLVDWAEAEPYYNAALNIRTLLQPTPQFDLLASYYSLASLNREKDDHKRAEIFGSNALRMAEGLTINRPLYLSFCNSLLANINYEKAKVTADSVDFANSLNYHRQAISLHPGANQSTLSDYYLNMGAVYRLMLQFDSANYYFFRALKLKSQSDQDSEREIADILLNIGWGYTGLKDYRNANLYYQRCLGLRKALNNPKQLAEVYKDLGEMYESFDSLDTSLAHYQKALSLLIPDLDSLDIYDNPQVSSVTNDEDIFQLVTLKAKVLTKKHQKNHQLHDLQTALELYQLANQLNDLNRNSNIYDESKLYLSNFYQADFENALEACYQLFQITGNKLYLEDLFKFMEKDKYMLLFESLIKANLNNKIGLPDSTIKRERELKVEMSRLEQKLAIESKKQAPKQDSLEIYNANLLSLDRDLENLKREISVSFPGYYSIQYDSITRTIESVQQSLRDSNNLLIEYYWGKNTIYALGISASRVRVIKVQNNDVLNDHLQSYMQSLIENPDLKSRVDNYPRFVQSAFWIYKQLVHPFIDEGINKLILIPDGQLAFVPFESLITQQGYATVNYRDLDYLLKHYEVQYGHSSNLLFQDHQRIIKKPKVMAFGHSDLAGSSKELSALDESVNASLYEGSEASETNFKKYAPNYNILHLAVHGEGDEESMLNSKLHFNTQENSQEDGELNVYELYNIDLKAQLAVLSACETGIGKQLAGEGVYSLSRAFAYAGCSSLIMSLWKTNDQSSAAIFKDFYQFLNSGASTDQALRIAKLNYLAAQDNISAHPSSWAALIPMGDSKWTQKEFNWWPLLVVGLGITGLIFYRLYFHRYRAS